MPTPSSKATATAVCNIPIKQCTQLTRSALTTQLYSVPPWAAAFAFSQVVAYFSDRLRHRFLFTIIPICITLVGLAMLLNIHNHRHVEYGALFLVTSGTYSAMPVIVCWFAMNLGGHKRRSVGTAWQVGFGNSTFISPFLSDEIY